MDAATLAALSRKKPLTERDQQHLAMPSLNILSEALATWMEIHGKK